MELHELKVGDIVEWDIWQFGGTFTVGQGRVIAIIHEYLVIHNEAVNKVNPKVHAIVCKLPSDIRIVPGEMN